MVKTKASSSSRGVPGLVNLLRCLVLLFRCLFEFPILVVKVSELVLVSEVNDSHSEARCQKKSKYESCTVVVGSGRVLPVF